MTTDTVYGQPVTTYDDLRRAFVTRRRELGLTQEIANDLAGLQGGYLNKLECGMRRWGPISLPMTLAALDLELILMPKEIQA